MLLRTVSAFWLIGALVGCGQSPLLNHADAQTLLGAEQRSNQEKKQCPLLFEKSDMCASLTWTKGPYNEEKGEFTLRFWSKSTGSENGPYLDPAFVLAVKLWMPSMGHGSSPVRITQARDSLDQPIAGVYDVTDVYFVMPGKWEIFTQFKKDSKVVDQTKVELEL